MNLRNHFENMFARVATQFSAFTRRDEEIVVFSATLTRSNEVSVVKLLQPSGIRLISATAASFLLGVLRSFNMPASSFLAFAKINQYRG